METHPIGVPRAGFRAEAQTISLFPGTAASKIWNLQTTPGQGGDWEPSGSEFVVEIQKEGFWSKSESEGRMNRKPASLLISSFLFL